MPDLTPNLNLKKPNWETDVADIRVFNDNMDIIDEKITDGNEAIQNLEEKKQNKEDSTLKTIAKTIVGAINELFTTKLDKGGYTGNAKNLNDEISKKASKTVLGRMIVGDNLTVDDNGRVSATKTEIVNDLTTGGTDKAGSADMVKKLGEDKQNKTDNELETNSKKIVGAINESLWRTNAKEITPSPSGQSIFELAKTLEDGIYVSRTTGHVWSDMPLYIRPAFYMKVETVTGLSSGAKNRVITLRNYADTYMASAYVDDNKKWCYHVLTNTQFFNSVIGTDQVRFIQDEGTKYKGKMYFDKVTFKPYRPKATNSDIDITDKFVLADMYTNSDKIANIISFDDKSVNTGHKIIFKTGTADTTKNNGVVTFNTPFPNACLSVIFTDTSSSVSGVSAISLDYSTPITKNGFKAFGNSVGSSNTYNYLAIGY